MSAAKIRAIVVDDEPLALAGLVRLLEADPAISVVAACGDGHSAIAAIAEHRPELLFLDVQMPEVDGFEVLRRIPRDQMPAVIFVTAFDEFAVRAFDVNAIDYLLKPFDDERFASALQRAKRAIELSAPDEQRDRLRAMLADLASGPEVSQIAIHEPGRVYFVPIREIAWIEGADYYAKLHTKSGTHLLRETLTSLENRLDVRRFFRVHRSAIVNLAAVRELRASTRGDSDVVLTDGTLLRLSRARRAEFEQLLERAISR